MSASVTSSFRRSLNRNRRQFQSTVRSRSFTATAGRRRDVQEAYIISAARTPVAAFNGALMSVPAPQLGGHAIKAAISRSGLDPSAVTAVYMGNVLSANSGQAPARQAVIAAGLSTSVEATTINKVCASGMKAVALASQQIQLGLESVVVAGGMENMSRVPYYLPRGSQMPPFGEMKLLDGMISDGLWDPYNNVHMGICAETTAKKYKISREAQDGYAIESYRRAQEAWKNKAFEDEIVEVSVKGRKGDTVVKEDEGYNKLKLDKVPTLKPAFLRDGTGTVTAANASSFNDGASALVLASRDVAREHAKGSRVLARIVSTADAAMDPIDFPIAPSKAIPIALERAGISAQDVAVWEINEAFAAVVVANAQILGLDNDAAMDKVNPLGGAIPLGHAIGSSGSRILTTMVHKLKPGEFGCAAICNGGGAASAMVVQRVDAI